MHKKRWIGYIAHAWMARDELQKATEVTKDEVGRAVCKEMTKVSECQGFHGEGGGKDHAPHSNMRTRFGARRFAIRWAGANQPFFSPSLRV